MDGLLEQEQVEVEDLLNCFTGFVLLAVLGRKDLFAKWFALTTHKL